MDLKTKLYKLHAWRDNAITFVCTQGENAAVEATDRTLTNVSGKCVQIQLIDDNGAVDLTNCSVDYMSTNKYGQQNACDIVYIQDATTGQVLFPISTSITSLDGEVKGEIVVTDENNSITKFFGLNFIILEKNEKENITTITGFTSLIDALNRVYNLQAGGSVYFEADTIDTTIIKDGAITNAKLATDSVTGDKIVDKTIVLNNLSEELVSMIENSGGTSGGTDGLSAYQIALNNGFEGTEEEWLESLKGADGAKGDDGYTPVKGTDYFTEDDKTEMVNILKNTCIVQNYAEQDVAILGEELANANNWTLGTGWSGSFTDGFTHVSGNAEPLTFTPTITAGKLYQVTFKSSVRMTTTNLFVQVGGSTQFNLYGEDTTNDTGNVSIGVLAVDTTGLVFTPDSSFTGTLTDISIKEITGSYEAVQQYFDTNEAVSFEIHVTPRGLENVFIGQATGEINTTGHENVGIGVNVLARNTSGFWNVGIGKDCLMNNIGGSRNLAIGYNALRNNEVGQRNVALGTFTMTQMKNGNWNIAIGSDSMNEATGGDRNVAVGFNTLTHNTGNNNVALGADVLSSNTSGIRNIGIGQAALAKNTTGGDNVCIGYNSGTASTTAKQNVALGWATLYKLTTGNNNIAIGYGAGKTLTTGKGNIIIGVEPTVEAAGNYQLNIGDLLKGSVNPNDLYLSLMGGLRLPNIATSRKGNDEVYTEEWTFTLEDGSTVTKKVLMK